MDMLDDDWGGTCRWMAHEEDHREDYDEMEVEDNEMNEEYDDEYDEEYEEYDEERYLCATLIDIHLVVAVSLRGNTSTIHVVSRSDVTRHATLPLDDVIVTAITSIPSTLSRRFLVICSYPAQQRLYTLDPALNIELMRCLPHEEGYVVAMSQPVDGKLAVVTCMEKMQYNLSLVPTNGDRTTFHIESGERASDGRKGSCDVEVGELVKLIEDQPTLGQRRLALKNFDPFFVFPDLVCLTQSAVILWDTFTNQLKSIRHATRALQWEWPLVPFQDFDVSSVCATPSYVFVSGPEAPDKILCLDATSGTLLGHYDTLRLEVTCPDVLLFDQRKGHLLALKAEPLQCVSAYVGKQVLRVKGRRFHLRTTGYRNSKDPVRCL